MDAIWNSFVEWLRGFGAQAGQQAAEAGAQIGGQVAEGVGAAASHLDMTSLLALAAALGWASGFRLYAVVFLVGAAGLYQGLFWKRVQGRWMQPVSHHA